MANSAAGGPPRAEFTVPISVDFAFELDSFNSHLNIMRVNQNSHKSDSRQAFPFVTCLCPWEDIQFDVPLSEERAGSQFKQKFILNNLTDQSHISCDKLSTSTQSDQLIDCVSCEFPDKFHFKSETLAVKGLQLLTVEPWNDVMTIKETFPSNIICEELYPSITVCAVLLEDPLKTEVASLVSATASGFGLLTESLLSVPAFVFSQLSQLNSKEIIYPGTALFKSFLDFQRSHNQESFCWKQKSSYATAVRKSLTGCNLKETRKVDLPKFQALIKLSSVIEAENLHQKMEEMKLSKTCTKISSKSSSSNLISVDLPVFSLDILNHLQSYLTDCWKNVIQLNLPTVVIDLLKNNHSILDLQPSTTRLCLVRVKEEITKFVKISNQFPNKINAELENSLPTLISLHGVNKAIDIFLNVDFNYAFKSLSDFFQTHEQVLKTNEFKRFLHRLRPLIPNESEIVHPKLLELRNQILKHLEENGNAGCKVWIRLLRHSNVIAPHIYALLTEAGIDCVVDPRIWRCGNSKMFDGSQNVIIAEKIASNFPRDLLSLIINYERPSVTFPHLSTIPQLTLNVERPVFVENSRKTPEIEEISYCGFHPALNPTEFSSPVSHCLPPNPEKLDKIQMELVTDCSVPAIYDLPSAIVNSAFSQIVTASNSSKATIEDFQTVATKESVDEFSIAMGDCSEVAEELSTHQLSTSITSESLEILGDEMDCHFHIICASHVKQNVELMDAIELVEDIKVYECDYSFLEGAGIYQPDILISSETALLIVSANESEDLKETRMKVLSASFKLSKCWIIVVAPDMITSSKLPNFWHSLYGLSLFYEKKNQAEPAFPFQLKLHLAVNYTQAAFIMKDIILDELDGEVGEIHPHLQPVSYQAHLILHFSHFNAVSAQLIAEHITAAEILDLDEETLISRVPSQKLCKRIKVFRLAMELGFNEDDGIESPFGDLESHLGENPKGKLAFFQLPSPKRAKLESAELEHRADELLKMWTSPVLSK